MTTEHRQRVEIFESYVGRGAPTPPEGVTSGSHVGYGLTKDQAIANAHHWKKDLPFVKVRSLTIEDNRAQPAFISRKEEVAWSIVGWHRENRPSALQEYCAQMIRRGKLASAILTYLRG